MPLANNLREGLDALQLKLSDSAQTQLLSLQTNPKKNAAQRHLVVMQINRE